MKAHTGLNLFRTIHILLALTLLSCAGGTRGTGGDREILGKILTTGNAPIDGATVTLVETGDSGTTDQTGTVSFPTDASGDLSFVIQHNNVDVTVSVSDISGAAQQVVITIVVDEPRNTAAVTNVEEHDNSGHGNGNGSSNGNGNGNANGNGNGHSSSSDDQGDENSSLSSEDDNHGGSSSDGNDGMEDSSSSEQASEDNHQGSSSSESGDHGHGGSSSSSESSGHGGSNHKD